MNPIQTHICHSCEAFVPGRWAYPELGEHHGSEVVCDDGRICDRGNWCKNWRLRRPDQEGRLF